MDHVYREIQSEEWKLPDSEYVDESESPLSLLTPIKDLSPSTTSSDGEMTPTHNQQKETVPSDAYVTTYCLRYPEPHTKQTVEKQQQQQEMAYHTRQHDHIIASNERITSIRPQSVSILWSNNIKTTYHVESTEDEDSDSSTSMRHDPSMISDASPEPVRPILPPKESEQEHNESSPTKKKKKHLKFNFYRTRTITSYDSQTSLYLKSMFFNVYSKQKKLTKEQRAEVQRKTGLNSRNITYWFSNHKRRFKDALKVYRKAVDESGGEIKDYQDFIHWRRAHNLPDQVTQDELI